MPWCACFSVVCVLQRSVLDLSVACKVAAPRTRISAARSSTLSFNAEDDRLGQTSLTDSCTSNHANLRLLISIRVRPLMSMRVCHLAPHAPLQPWPPSHAAPPKIFFPGSLRSCCETSAALPFRPTGFHNMTTDHSWPRSSPRSPGPLCLPNRAINFSLRQTSPLVHVDRWGLKSVPRLGCEPHRRTATAAPRLSAPSEPALGVVPRACPQPFPSSLVGDVDGFHETLLNSMLRHRLNHLHVRQLENPQSVPRCVLRLPLEAPTESSSPRMTSICSRMHSETCSWEITLSN